jgi:hypothetical protein
MLDVLTLTYDVGTKGARDIFVMRIELPVYMA